MEVNSNRIGDIRSHYRLKLSKSYSERESDTLIFAILEHYTGKGKAAVLSGHEERVSESELLKIHFAVKQLLQNKPIQYILGETDFYGLKFKVNSKVLIPRPETEELVEIILKEVSQAEGLKILDIGTGSGNIPVTLAKKMPQHKIHALDVSSFALEVARENAQMNAVDIRFHQYDILNQPIEFPETDFDIIISNPPYVRQLEKEAMKPNVLDFEPSLALFVEDDDPLLFYRAIVEFGKEKLVAGGRIYVEINQYLSNETQKLFEENGYHEVEVHTDMNGNFRMLSCVILISR